MNLPLALAHLFQVVAVGLSLAAFLGLGWLLYQFHAVGREIDRDRFAGESGGARSSTDKHRSRRRGKRRQEDDDA